MPDYSEPSKTPVYHATKGAQFAKFVAVGAEIRKFYPEKAAWGLVGGSKNGSVPELIIKPYWKWYFYKRINAHNDPIEYTSEAWCSTRIGSGVEMHG